MHTRTSKALLGGLALALVCLLVAILFTAPGTVSAAGGLDVYDDSLNPGWQDWSWGSDIRLESSYYVHSGSHALKVNTEQGYAGLYLHANSNLSGSDYDTLAFYVHGGDRGGQLLRLGLVDGNGDFVFSDVLVAPNAGQWVGYEVALSALGSPAAISGIYLQDTTGKNQRPFWIDEIRLNGAGGGATATVIPPTATQVPPPTTTTTPPPPTATSVPPSVTPPPTPAPTQPPPPPPEASGGIWLNSGEIAGLPSGGALNNLYSWAAKNETPNLSDRNNQGDAVAFAAAVACVRDGSYCNKAIEYIQAAPETENGGHTLPLSRNLAGYVIAADLMGYHDPGFENWVAGVLHEQLDGRAGIHTIWESALKDPSNHGHHARTSVLAASLYLGDAGAVQQVAETFHDWLGRDGSGFVWKELDWHADPNNPLGINPGGSQIMIDGKLRNVDGVLPDDQRRNAFTWPPPCEGYVWEALQGVSATARILSRQGYDAWNWENAAIRRAYTWLHQQASCPASGDDSGLPYLINAVYGTSFPTPSVSDPGKNGLGFYNLYGQ